jgi:hypothetical protein
MLSTERSGSSNRSLVIMFLNPLPDINRVPELPEVPTASSVDGCGAPASRKAFNKRSLRSKQLAAGGQTLTCAFRRSGVGGLDLFTTTITRSDLLGLGRWWVGQSHVLNPGWSSCVLSASGCLTGGSGAGVAEIGSGSSKPKANEVLRKQNQIYHQTSRKSRGYVMNKELHSQRGFLHGGLLKPQYPWLYRWRGHIS